MGLALPNGHYVFLAQMGKAVSNVAGYSGTTNVARDVLVDVDQNYKPDRVPMLLVDEAAMTKRICCRMVTSKDMINTGRCVCRGCTPGCNG